jgi:hypothetical protein
VWLQGKPKADKAKAKGKGKGGGFQAEVRLRTELDSNLTAAWQQLGSSLAAA